MTKIPCFHCAQPGHTIHDCPNTNIIGCKVEGCRKYHNPAAHKNFEEHLAKGKGGKGGKKVGVKAVSTEETAPPATDTNSPPPAPAQAQTVSHTDYAALQAKLKQLSDRQSVTEMTQLCFAKMYSPGDSILVNTNRISTYEAAESDPDMNINNIKSNTQCESTFNSSILTLITQRMEKMRLRKEEDNSQTIQIKKFVYKNGYLTYKNYEGQLSNAHPYVPIQISSQDNSMSINSKSLVDTGADKAVVSNDIIKHSISKSNPLI